MQRLLHRATLGLLIGFACSLCACSSQSSRAGDPGAIAGGAGSTVGCRPSDADVYSAGMTKPGAAGHFEFTLVSSTPAPPALGDNRFLVQVSDADGNAMSGDLSVALEMPEHGHSSPAPEVGFDPENGVFSLQPVRLFMVGLWRASFAFQGSLDGVPLTDSAVFELCID
ncbi:MAG TPA: hypothetical protein VER04_09255 [Polyangiaceae bacterium]|nr:hypothetical protein [Polyangiaceae bacterium]